MSTFATLASLLTADLVTAGVASLAAEVYTGRRPQRITKPAEVWLERGESLRVGSSAQRQTAHTVYVHLIERKRNAGPHGTGSVELLSLEDKAETITERYRGEPPAAFATAGIYCLTATEDDIDADSEELGQQALTVRVEITEHA